VRHDFKGNDNNNQCEKNVDDHGIRSARRPNAVEVCRYSINYEECEQGNENTGEVKIDPFEHSEHRDENYCKALQMRSSAECSENRPSG
jgi:hypothetical protein